MLTKYLFWLFLKPGITILGSMFIGDAYLHSHSIRMVLFGKDWLKIKLSINLIDWKLDLQKNDNLRCLREI